MAGLGTCRCSPAAIPASRIYAKAGISFDIFLRHQPQTLRASAAGTFFA